MEMQESLALVNKVLRERMVLCALRHAFRYERMGVCNRMIYLRSSVFWRLFYAENVTFQLRGWTVRYNDQRDVKYISKLCRINSSWLRRDRRLAGNRSGELDQLSFRVVMLSSGSLLPRS
jgi:hypothetical protein